MISLKKLKISACYIGILTPLFLIWNSSTWDAGFYHDDAVTSSYYGEAKLNNQGIFCYAHEQLKNMIAYQGRFAPAYNYFITTFLVLFGDSLLLYRVWHSVWLFLSLLTATYFIVRITQQQKVGPIFFIFTLSLMSVTTYHDPLLSYGVVLPQVVFFGLFGLILLQKSFENDGWAQQSYYYCSSICLIISVLTSEFGLTFIALAMIIIILKTKNIADLKFIACPVLISGVYFGLTLGLKKINQYSGTSFGKMDFETVFQTFLFQLSGSIPSAFIFSKMAKPVFTLEVIKQLFIAPSFWITLILIIPAFCFFGFAGQNFYSKNNFKIFLFGTILLLIPALMTAISEKYQKELMWGVAYMQSYIQLLGLGFIFLGLYLTINNHIKRKKNSLHFPNRNPYFFRLCFFR